MFLDEQISRLQIEEQTLLQYLDDKKHIEIKDRKGQPADYYCIGFNDVCTSVVDNIEELNISSPPVRIKPVSFRLIINIPDVYPLMKPDLSLTPAFDDQGGHHFIYHSHVQLFAICLFASWECHYSLVDVVQRTYNLLTYNEEDLINLDKTDVVNPGALDWYKSIVNEGSRPFPLQQGLPYEDIPVAAEANPESASLFLFSEDD